jgi:hypothetical protein
MQVTAQLIKHKILDIKKIIPHFSPNLKETEENFAKNISETQKAYNTIHTRIAKELTFSNGNYLMLTQPSSNSASAQAPENSPASAIPNYFVNFNEYVNDYLNSSNPNQFYQLLRSLVKIRDLKSCDFIHGLLESSFDPIGSSELVGEICKVLREMIAPLYKSAGLERKLKIKNKEIRKRGVREQGKANNGAEACYNAQKKVFDMESIKMFIDEGETIENYFDSSNAQNGLLAEDEDEDSFKSAEDFIIRLPRILKFITLGLGFDQILFQKILQLIKHFGSLFVQNPKNLSYNNFNDNKISNNEYQSIITDLICKVFLPAISIIDPTPTLLNSLWSVINLFDYSKRYKVYSYWMNYLYSTHPVLYLRSRVILRETSKWQNTFSKENQKSHGRILGILTKSNPVIIFDKIIKPLTSYDNQIDIIIKALSYGSSLQHDVISYVIGKTLTDSTKEKLDMNFGDVHNWFKNFCYFVGCFYKEYQNVDFSFVFHYLMNQLKNKNQNCYIEFLIMKEIIEKMSMVFTQETMDESQVQSSYGGIYLYLEAMDILKEYKNLNKPIQNLLKFFMGDVLGGSGEKEKIVSKINAAISGLSKNGNSESKEKINGKCFLFFLINIFFI